MILQRVFLFLSFYAFAFFCVSLPERCPWVNHLIGFCSLYMLVRTYGLVNRVRLCAELFCYPPQSRVSPTTVPVDESRHVVRFLQSDRP